jgi:hypothetical protein
MPGFFVMLTPLGGYINVNPEFSLEINGVSPTGRYHIFYADPQNGSCTFYLEQDQDCTWISKSKPAFITDDFIKWVAERIESDTEK